MSSPDSTPSLVAVRRGLTVSALSLAWTLVVGTTSVAVGLFSDSLALVAFGLIGLLDAAGSATLVVHFRHALRHTALSDQHERLALRLVASGMVAVGLGTLATSIHKLAQTGGGRGVALTGLALAGVSAVVLPVLAWRKRRIAPLIPSAALHADGALSAIGAVLAVLTLAGTAADRAAGWWWGDPAAATGLGAVAVVLGAVLLRGRDLGDDAAAASS